MNPVQELNDDLLVEEGHYLERIQSEALEEGFLYATIRDFESLAKEYGIGEICNRLSPSTKHEFFYYLWKTECS
jgi:hypothetical protein